MLSVASVIASTNASFDNFALHALGPASTDRTRSTAPVPLARTHGDAAPTPSAAIDLPQIDELALYEDGGDGRPGERRSLFPAGHQHVYLVMELAEPARLTYEARRIAVRGSEERMVKQSSCSANGVDRRVWLYLERAWTPGLYWVELYANGSKLDEREFSVE